MQEKYIEDLEQFYERSLRLPYGKGEKLQDELEEEASSPIGDEEDVSLANEVEMNKKMYREWLLSSTSRGTTDSRTYKIISKKKT